MHTASEKTVMSYFTHDHIWDESFQLITCLWYCETLNYGGSIYYLILAPLISVFLLDGLSNTIK